MLNLKMNEILSSGKLAGMPKPASFLLHLAHDTPEIILR
jgi:hypothetical protein